MIGVIGAEGFIGNKIYERLCEDFPKEDIIPITRATRYNYVGYHFRSIVNANGNSKKYWAEENPVLDFEASVGSVYRTIFDFKTDQYIYLSSLDVFKDNIYGRNKSVAENVVLSFSDKFIPLILRLGAVIGLGMKKGVIFDILNDIPLRLHPSSKLQFITVEEVAKIVSNSIPDYSGVLEIAGSTSLSIKEVAKLLKKTPQFIDGPLDKQHYEFGVNLMCETSEKYIKDFLKEIHGRR